jgi:hypothetical protein
MLYLGRFENEYYALHDLYEYYEESDREGEGLVRYPANQVMVTPLSIRRANGATFSNPSPAPAIFVPA